MQDLGELEEGEVDALQLPPVHRRRFLRMLQARRQVPAPHGRALCPRSVSPARRCDSDTARRPPPCAAIAHLHALLLAQQ